MPASISIEQVNEILKKICLKRNIVEWSFDEVEFNKIVQNYFGIIIPVRVTGKIKGEEVTLSLVLKFAPTDERFRVSGAITIFFAKEIFTYTVILRKYQEYQSQFLSLYVFPKCHYVSQEYCKEVIVLQDMTAEGYKSYTKGRFVDYNHALVCLKSLAKFHALSFVMKSRDPKLYEAVSLTCTPLTVTTNKRFFEVLADRLNKAAHKFEDTEYKPIIENLQKNYTAYVDLAWKSVQNTCICHGDIWKENIMFKYQNEMPISACIIDYQTCRVSSPAYDVLYFIMSSTDSELRRLYFDQLLNVYYENFVQTLKKANLQPQTIYTREVFNKDLKDVGPACLIVVNTAMWLSHGLQEEGHVISKNCPRNSLERIQATEQYVGVMKNIIDDLRSYNYLCPCLSFCDEAKCHTTSERKQN